MAKLSWYKRYMEDALSGMRNLTMEERGAYNGVLDLMYLHGNKLRDDDCMIAAGLSSDVRVWRRLKRQIMVKGKLTSQGGFLRNGRVDKQVEKITTK